MILGFGKGAAENLRALAGEARVGWGGEGAAAARLASGGTASNLEDRAG
jgi:hypothetical protein